MMTTVIRPDMNRWHHQMKAISLSWLPCAHRGSHCYLCRDSIHKCSAAPNKLETQIINSLPLFFDSYNKERRPLTSRQTRLTYYTSTQGSHTTHLRRAHSHSPQLLPQVEQCLCINSPTTCKYAPTRLAVSYGTYRLQNSYPTLS